MQTFLPLPSYTESAQILDTLRLGKQRVETMQIYLALTDRDYGWQNHPAIRMWRGFDVDLLNYGIAICAEWIRRGNEDSTMRFFLKRLLEAHQAGLGVVRPAWLGDQKFHYSHQMMLISKEPFYYLQFAGNKFASIAELGEVKGYFWPNGE